VPCLHKPDQQGITKVTNRRKYNYKYIEEIIDSADRKLFTRITQPGHCLHHLLPPKTSAYCPYSLRKRQHSYQLPHIEFSQYKNRLINRCLFKFRRLTSLYIFVVFRVSMC